MVSRNGKRKTAPLRWLLHGSKLGRGVGTPGQHGVTDGNAASQGPVRLDASDAHVFDRPARGRRVGRSGRVRVCRPRSGDCLPARSGSPSHKGFLGLSSFGRATVTVVATATAADRRAAVEACWPAILQDRYGAPSREAAALKAAEGRNRLRRRPVPGLRGEPPAASRARDRRQRARSGSGSEAPTDRANLDHTKIWTLVPDDGDDGDDGQDARRDQDAQRNRG